MYRPWEYPDYVAELEGVMTVSEVVEYAQVSRATIRYHIDRGNLAARCVNDRVWIISRSSVYALYRAVKGDGKPRYTSPRAYYDRRKRSR